jgi:phosphoglycolate phosphatase
MRMNVPYSAVIFDLDGTLLDTLADIAESSNRVLASHGLPTFPVDDYRQFVGQGLRRLLERVIPAGDEQEPLIQTCSREFREVYSREWNVRTRPYPGVLELVELLRSRGIRMAVLSNKPHEFTQRCVEHYLAGTPFEVVLGEGNGIPPKPDPTGARRVIEQIGLAPEKFVYLGDTSTDMATAIAAGTLPVGALWGFRPREELEAAGAKHLIERPGELIEIMEGNA